MLVSTLVWAPEHNSLLIDSTNATNKQSMKIVSAQMYPKTAVFLFNSKTFVVIKLHAAYKTDGRADSR